MEKLSPETKKTSAWKAFGGGIAALGIFASLLALGNFDFSETKTLQAEVLATEAPAQTTTTAAAITLLNPATGETGDLVQLTVENLENFDETTSAVFFEADTAKIITVEAGEENKTVLTVQVPPLTTAGDYAVKIVTPTGMTESAQKFTLLVTVEPTEIPPTADLPTSTEINLGDFDNVLKTEATATLFENNFEFEKTAPTSPSGISTTVSPPQNLTVNSSSTGIQLSWQKPVTGKAEKFNIYYGSQSGNYLHRVESENFAEVISQNLESGKIYFFTIKSVDTFGDESPASDKVSAIFAAKSVENSTGNFYSAASHPPQLSKQGPAASLAIAFLVTLAVALFGFRKKIWAGK
jgi:hypothetical protein